MKMSVIGTGYLGATHAAAMAELGHDVIGVDVDAAKIETLRSGRVPFHEPGLPELLSRQVERGALRFTTSVDEAMEFADVHFVCVGTPQRQGELGADLRHVQAAFAAVVARVRPGATVVGKSTVPVGTAALLAPALQAGGATLVWNPEFLREGFAVQDTLSPDRIVLGIADGAGSDDVGRAALRCSRPTRRSWRRARR